MVSQNLNLNKISFPLQNPAYSVEQLANFPTSSKSQKSVKSTKSQKSKKYGAAITKTTQLKQ